MRLLVFLHILLLLFPELEFARGGTVRLSASESATNITAPLSIDRATGMVGTHLTEMRYCGDTAADVSYSITANRYGNNPNNMGAFAAMGSGTAWYDFKVEDGGYHWVSFEVNAASSASNSFFLSMDGGEWWMWGNIPVTGKDVVRVPFSKQDTLAVPGMDHFCWRLREGMHSVAVKWRELGTWFRSIAISDKFPKIKLNRIAGCSDGLAKDCSTEGGENIFVEAQSLCEDVRIEVDGRPCRNVSIDPAFPNRNVSCVMPEGIGSDLTVVIYSAKRSATVMKTVSYGFPEITSVSGCVDRLQFRSVTEGCKVGDVITIRGKNFGRMGATVKVHGAPCFGVRHSDLNPHRELTCTLAKPISSEEEVVVSQMMAKSASFDGVRFESSFEYSMVITISVMVVLAVIIPTLVVIFMRRRRRAPPVPYIRPSDIQFKHILGIGSRGVIFKATWRGSAVAVKLYMSFNEICRSLDDEKANFALNSATSSSSAIGRNEFLLNSVRQRSSILRSVGFASKQHGNVLLLGRKRTNSTNAANGSAMKTSSESKSFNTSPSTPTAGRLKEEGSDPTSSSSSSSSANRIWGDIKRELKTIAALRSPNLVTVYGTTKVFGTPGVVLELMGNGSLFDAIHNPEIFLSTKKKLGICLDLARGIRHLHAQRPPVLHRDIKSLNCLLSDSFEAKIADFDLAVVCNIDGAKITKRQKKQHLKRETKRNCDIGVEGKDGIEPLYLRTRRQTHDMIRRATGIGGANLSLPTYQSRGKKRTMGTIAWAAPEIFTNGGLEHTTATDVYAFGVVMWEVFSEREPYVDTPMRTPQKISTFVTSGGRLAIPTDRVPEGIEAIIRDCWCSDPKLRPTIDEIVEALSTIYDEQRDEELQPSTRDLETAKFILGPAAMEEIENSFSSGVRPALVEISSVAIACARISISSDPIERTLQQIHAEFDAIVSSHGGARYSGNFDSLAYAFIVPPSAYARIAIAGKLRGNKKKIPGSSSSDDGTDYDVGYSDNTVIDDNNDNNPRRRSSSSSNINIQKSNDRTSTTAWTQKEASSPASPTLSPFSANSNDHVHRAGQILIEMNDLIQNFWSTDNHSRKNQPGSCFALTAGLHVGPITVQKDDPWTIHFHGKTIDIASRLECTSQFGRVQICDETARVLMGNPSLFALHPRDDSNSDDNNNINVNNKERLWFLERTKSNVKRRNHKQKEMKKKKEKNMEEKIQTRKSFSSKVVANHSSVAFSSASILGPKEVDIVVE